MKKFKLLCTVAAVVLAVGMFTTTAMAASFRTSTTYSTEGIATVTTTVTGITDEEVDSQAQVTYIAYKNNDYVLNADNILFIDQRKVESKDDMVFTYKVPKAKFEGVKVTAIGLGSSVAAPTAEKTEKVIGGCNVDITCIGKGTIKVDEADATVYPGNTALLNIEPGEGYEIYSLKVNGVESLIAPGATSYSLAVEGDTKVVGTFMAIDVDLDPDVTDWTGDILDDSLSKETVNELFPDVVLPDNIQDVKVKAVVGKLAGHPEYFDEYEYGLKVTYNDSTVAYFPALGCNGDYTFAVRLIDTTAEQNALDAVSVDTYIVKKDVTE